MAKQDTTTLKDQNTERQRHYEKYNLSIHEKTIVATFNKDDLITDDKYLDISYNWIKLLINNRGIYYL